MGYYDFSTLGDVMERKKKALEPPPFVPGAALPSAPLPPSAPAGMSPEDALDPEPMDYAQDIPSADEFARAFSGQDVIDQYQHPGGGHYSPPSLSARSMNADPAGDIDLAAPVSGERPMGGYYAPGVNSDALLRIIEQVKNDARARLNQGR